MEPILPRPQGPRVRRVLQPAARHPNHRGDVSRRDGASAESVRRGGRGAQLASRDGHRCMTEGNPSLDTIFAVMAAASVGDTSARVPLPADPRLDDVPTRLALALNVLLDDLAWRLATLERTQADQMRAHQAFRESEARNATIVEAAIDAIVSIDHQGRIVEFNP